MHQEVDLDSPKAYATLPKRVNVRSNLRSLISFPVSLMYANWKFFPEGGSSVYKGVEECFCNLNLCSFCVVTWSTPIFFLMS